MNNDRKKNSINYSNNENKAANVGIKAMSNQDNSNHSNESSSSSSVISEDDNDDDHFDDQQNENIHLKKQLFANEYVSKRILIFLIIF